MEIDWIVLGDRRPIIVLWSLFIPWCVLHEA